MAARLTIGKKNYETVQDHMQQALAQAEGLRSKLTGAIQRDADAYSAVLDAYRLPKGTPEQQAARKAAITAANIGAALVPLEVAGLSVEVLSLALLLIRDGNKNAISDVATAAALAGAAITGAACNVRINLVGMEADAASTGQVSVSAMLGTLERYEQAAGEYQANIRTIFEDRTGITSL